MDNEKCWVFSALLCGHCERVIYGHQSLQNNVRRSTLIRKARESGAVQRGEHWFCCRGCRTAHEISPGLPSQNGTARILRGL